MLTGCLRMTETLNSLRCDRFLVICSKDQMSLLQLSANRAEHLLKLSREELVKLLLQQGAVRSFVRSIPRG
jgi:hypothetical protein